MKHSWRMLWEDPVLASILGCGQEKRIQNSRYLPGVDSTLFCTGKGGSVRLCTAPFSGVSCNLVRVCSCTGCALRNAEVRGRQVFVKFLYCLGLSLLEIGSYCVVLGGLELTGYWISFHLPVCTSLAGP